MQYTITTEPIAERLTKVKVVVTDDQGGVILQGETNVGTGDPAVAYAYGEFPFLKDLRDTYPYELAGLVLPCDVVPEPPPVEPGV